MYSYECTFNNTKSFSPATKKAKKENEETAVGKGKLSQKMISMIFPELDTSDPSFNLDLFSGIFEQHRNSGILDLKKIIKDYNSGSGVKLDSKPLDPVEIKIILPPKEIAIKLIYRTWNDACQLFRFYHRTSFIRDVNSLYDTNPNEYSNHQNKMLPLVYSVIAVGALFSKGDNAIDNQYLQDEGYRYFIASRKLIDITNSTDLESIQTIFMLTLFLQCSARLSTCYSYIGIALRSALRQGLHKKLETKCDNIKAECKKRLFWTIYKMEIYVNSMLALPNSINECDIDAELPLDIDDSNIDYETIIPQVPGKLSSCGINNSHTKLILILNHIVQNLYKSSNPLFDTSIEKMKNLENELKVWLYELPPQLKPNVDCPPEYLKANKLLHLDYLHVQITLYRPFIHFVKLSKSSGHSKNHKSFQYENGLKCFEISKEIIILAEDMINKKLVNGSYWFSVYTIFFAVACLVYYFLEIDNENQDINQAIEKGKHILSNLKQRSVSAERIYNLLNHMFENYDRNNLKFDDLNIRSSSKSPQQYPLNSFTPSTEDNLINIPATHTVDGLDKVSTEDSIKAENSQPPTSPQQASNIINPQSYIPTGMADDFDLKIFGNFLPSYMLEHQILPTSKGHSQFDSTTARQPYDVSTTPNQHSEQQGVYSAQNIDGPQSMNWINPLDVHVPVGATNNQYDDNNSSSARSASGSIKTEDDEHIFDWERFFDKGDSINFDI